MPNSDNKQPIDPPPDDTLPKIIPRHRDTNLDGSPIEYLVETAEEDYAPPEPAAAAVDTKRLPPKKEIKPFDKSLRLYAVHDLEGKSFLRRIWVLIYDAETFFSYVDLNRETPAAITFVALIFGVNIAILIPVSAANDTLRKMLQPAFIAIAFASVLLFIFVVSFFGMILMSAYHKKYAGWRKIFGIYAYSTLPFALSFVGLSMYRGSITTMFFSMLILFPVLMLYIKLCGKGFEGAFGIDIFASPVYAVGIPVFTIILISITIWLISYLAV